jgi:2Fe-2S ferredoxin
LPRVTFVHESGPLETFEAPVGDSVMDCALDHGVRGITGQCGGGCTCATCHVYVAAPWRARVPPADGDERELLDYVPGRREDSRLACRIALTEALDGLVVRIP